MAVLAKVWVVGRIVERVAGVTVDGTAIDCSGNCEEWEDSGRVGEKRFEAAEWQQSDGYSVVRMAMAVGMNVEDSELTGSFDIRATADSGGHTVCASFVAGVLAGFVERNHLGRSSCAAFRS
jgi:hypothetical protein